MYLISTAYAFAIFTVELLSLVTEFTLITIKSDLLRFDKSPDNFCPLRLKLPSTARIPFLYNSTPLSKLIISPKVMIYFNAESESGTSKLYLNFILGSGVTVVEYKNGTVLFSFFAASEISSLSLNASASPT